MKTKFTASQFAPMQKFSTAEDKAKFANQFVRFVESDFKETIFPKWFYNRLSMTFGHIAHYNQNGFYGTFFDSTRGKVNFLQQTAHYNCYGSPEFTYSDVEQVLRRWVIESKQIEKYIGRLNSEIENAERVELDRLKAKYPEQQS